MNIVKLLQPEHPRLRAMMASLAIGIGLLVMTGIFFLLGEKGLTAAGAIISVVSFAFAIDMAVLFLMERSKERNPSSYDAHFLAGETED